jgi:hypothetical protein
MEPMATHTITLEVDSSKLFDMLHQLQQEAPTGCSTDALGVRMAELLMAPNDVSVIEQVGLALYGITVKAIEQ